MTLKGSNLHTKNASTIIHNPEGVEFRAESESREQKYNQTKIFVKTHGKKTTLRNSLNSAELRANTT
jgi:hypothetical protein